MYSSPTTIGRADKIVADLDSSEHLEQVGRALGERLGDVPAQGVPFTVELCRDGLVSWGVEPHQLPRIAAECETTNTSGAT
jgi:hypothetical protein